MKRSSLLFWILVSFSIINLLDIITATFILPGEANPIFLLTGSLSIVWILKIFVVGTAWAVYYNNKYPSPSFYYTFVYAMIVGSLLISLGVVSNVYGILNTEVIAEAEGVSTGEKVQYYFSMVGFLFFIPYILSIISFKVYDMTSGLVVFEKKKKKKKDGA